MSFQRNFFTSATLSLILVTSAVNITSCTSKKDTSGKKIAKQHDDLLPPQKYSEWLSLDAENLEKLTLLSLKSNERFWINYRLFDIYKDLNLVKACQFLSLAQKDSAKFKLNNFILLNDSLFCSEKFPDYLLFTELENKLYKENIVRSLYKKGVVTSNPILKISNGIEIANLEKNRNDKLRFYKALETETLQTADNSLQNLFNAALRKEFPQYLVPTDTNRIEIATDFIKDRNFAKARENLNHIIKLPNSKKEDIFKSYKTLFRIEKSLQDKKAQEKVILQWWKWLQKELKQKKISIANYDNWFSELLVLKARWYWTEGDPQKAIKLLKNSAKLIKDPTKKEELFYTLGRIYDEKKDYSQSKLNYEQSFKVSLQKGAVFEKNLWSLAWLEYKSKNYLSAQNQLELLISKIKDDSDSKYKYWLAKCYLLQGKQESYLNTISLLRNKEPLSFYTLLTYRDQKEKITLLAKSSQLEKIDFVKETLRNSLSPEEFTILMWHLSFKQNTILKEWAKYIIEQDSNNFLPSLILYAKAEMYSNLITSINQLNSEQKSDLLQKYPELLFPKPYWELVNQFATQRNVIPSFVYSIMRQESAFDPFARSPVDALGLLQLMPALGKKLAKEEAMTFEHDFDLFKENVNIALGTKELSRLLQSNKNKYIPAIAGYNASPAAYNGWIKSRYRSDVIEFIEEIPYEETRTYIKLIIRNMIFYDRIYFQNQGFEYPDFLLTI